jgi:hypothetical protein|tara:strand:+ start:1363 stop:1644 length:282 start_codon:yes stop_codon:yes gene_type:complete
MKDILFNNIKILYANSSKQQSHIGINVNTYEIYTFSQACKIDKAQIQWVKVYFRENDIQIHTLVDDDFDSFCLSQYLDLLLIIYKKKYCTSTE